MTSAPNSMPPIDDNDLPPRRSEPDEIDDAPPLGAVGISSAPVPPHGPTSQPFRQDGPITLPDPDTDSKIIDHNLRIQNEHWIKAYWRPAMGWLYMLICFVDFVLFPAMTMFLPALFKGFGVTMQYTAWQSLTLSNGGLMHIAFGAILGVAAWSRGQEKIAGSR